jgi:ABC-type branched-subunit amino acid transport system substrate-binding protein
MKLSRRLSAATSAVTIGFALAGVAVAQDVPSLDLKFGVLAGLSGDLAQSGQPWTEAVRLGVDDVARQVESWGYSDKIKISFVGAEDSQGNAQGGIEAAKKLVGVNGANVVVGDFFSSVTVAAAQSVFIPEEIIDFTGGTAPSITDLNKSTGATWVWRVAPPDSIQGPVVAKLISDSLGADKTINVAARNDTYGVGLLDAFKQAWTAGGGKIGTETIYNPDAPTLDSEAQQIASGNPDGWFLVSFCGDWGKLKGPLQRTGSWDPLKTFGGDALGGCPVPNETLAGMRNARGDVSSGESNAAWVELFNERGDKSVPYASWTAEAFDTPYIAFLAALAAGSSETNAIREKLPAVTSAPGTQCDFTTLKTCVDAILAGEDVDFDGASGAIAFDEFGDPSIVTYVILESKGDGAIDDPVIGRVTLGE